MPIIPLYGVPLELQRRKKLISFKDRRENMGERERKRKRLICSLSGKKARAEARNLALLDKSKEPRILLKSPRCVARGWLTAFPGMLSVRWKTLSSEIIHCFSTSVGLNKFDTKLVSGGKILRIDFMGILLDPAPVFVYWRFSQLKRDNLTSKFILPTSSR